MATPDIVFHRLADHEYRKAVTWYRLRSPNTASRFLAAVNYAIRRIEEGLNSLPIAVEAYRYVRVKKFPYTIVCRPRIDGDIEIVAVAHTSRRPQYWRRRS